MGRKVYKSAGKSTNVRGKIMRGLTRLALLAAWRAAPGQTARFFKEHFFKPSKYRPTPIEQRWLQTGERFQVCVNGRTVQCRRWGKGPGALFVHGWDGSGIQFSEFFDRVVAAGYAAIAFDAPAHGESEGTTTSYFEFTDTVRTILDPALELDIRCVVAHSFGASATINALSKDKYPITPVLIAPALKLEELTTDTFQRYGVPEVLFRSTIEEYEERYGYTFHDANPFRLIGDVPYPILILHDKNDRTTPYTDSKAAAEKYDNVRLNPTEGLGHKRILKDRETHNRILDYFRQTMEPVQMPG